ncbi:MAG: hypothetical protein GF329_05120 [Candidatus Lokiarchaeota archaeon]|nr:hypothetical protein [Candidatus Lokiarchaeota archaeon]
MSGTIENHWTLDDEREHFPCLMEWWSTQAFLKLKPKSEYWILKATFTQWNKKMKYPGSLLNMIIYNPAEKKHYVYHNLDNKNKLESSEKGFEIKFEDSLVKGKFPKYIIYLHDKKNNIKIDLNYKSETSPHWIAQNISNGWLPMGFGQYRYGFIPRLKVDADITFKKDKIKSSGIGYYEHVWGNFWYNNPLLGFRNFGKSISTYTKLIGWWIKNHDIKIPNEIHLSSENSPFGYDWSWAFLDNGWSLFYGNILFWLKEGPAPGILILCKGNNDYITFDKIQFYYNDIKKSKYYDFYYPTDFSLLAKKSKKEISINFKIQKEPREYVSKFTDKAFWKAFVICEEQGAVNGYYKDNTGKINFKGIAKIEPQRQISILGHNTVDILIRKPPKEFGIDLEIDSNFFQKKIHGKFKLLPKPKICLKIINK